MKYFLMSGILNEDMLNKFIDFYNNEYEAITIVLNTQGGSEYYTGVIVSMINKHKNVSIIILGAYSAGMELLIQTTCKKYLSVKARGMWHYGKVEMWINDNNKAEYPEDISVVSTFPIGKKYCEKIAKQIMNKKEYNKFLKGHDIYFNIHRMKEIFPDATMLNP